MRMCSIIIDPPPILFSSRRECLHFFCYSAISPTGDRVLLCWRERHSQRTRRKNASTCLARLRTTAKTTYRQRRVRRAAVNGQKDVAMLDGEQIYCVFERGKLRIPCACKRVNYPHYDLAQLRKNLTGKNGRPSTNGQVVMRVANAEY